MYKSTGMSRKGIRGVVQNLKRAIGCENKYCFDVLSFLERVLPLLDEEFSFEIVTFIENDPNCYAKTYPDNKKIVLTESVYNRAYNGSPRDRFTVAHEIGHLLLHNDINISFARGQEEIPTYENPEWQANTFAAELLVPTHLIKDMSIDEISLKCNVSRQVASIQKKYSF